MDPSAKLWAAKLALIVLGIALVYIREKRK
jgi:hypothetical protein